MTIAWRRHLISAMALATLVGACASTPSPAPYEISATGSDSQGDVVVTGKTNMPDGGIVSVYAWSDADNPHREWSGWTAVKDGAFSATVESSTWQADTVHLSIAILGDSRQPPEVLAVIGRDGERLAGTDAQTGEGGERFIEARFDVMNRAPSRT